MGSEMCIRDRSGLGVQSREVGGNDSMIGWQDGRETRSFAGRSEYGAGRSRSKRRNGDGDADGDVVVDGW